MQLCGSLSILWHCLSLGLEWKLTFSSPVATAEFSKFAGILSTVVPHYQSLSYMVTPTTLYTQPVYDEGLKLKLWYLGHWWKEPTFPISGKDPDAGKDWRQEEKGETEDEDVWMESSTQWTWVWANSRRYWRTEKTDMLQSMRLWSWTQLSDWTTTLPSRSTQWWPLPKVFLDRLIWVLYHFEPLIYSFSLVFYVFVSPPGLWRSNLHGKYKLYPIIFSTEIWPVPWMWELAVEEKKR